MAIESSPEVLNKLLSKLGAPESYQVHDVLGTDVSDLKELPGTIRSILLLLPKDEKYQEILEEKKAAAGEPQVFFIHLPEGSICGTVMLIHAVVTGNNNLVLEDCPLKRFLDEAQNVSATERGQMLLANEDIVGLHNEAVSEGESQQVDTPAHHLICFIRVGDQVYDMDSGAEQPHWLAECTDDNFAEEAIKAAKAYIDRNCDSYEFNILALVEQ